MKRIRALDGPTPGLVGYLNCDGEHASWDGFRSHLAGVAYREIIAALCSIQHGLCGYCENNMIACCKGGTPRTEDRTRRLDPVKRHRSCGEVKGGRADMDFVDPRTLPALPSLMRVRFDGEIAADEATCTNAGIDADKMERTIDILGLNVERLRIARERRWRALSDSCQGHFDDPQMMQEAARGELLPGEDSRLPRFFTTSRSYFGPAAEEVLAEAPQAWI